ncbi:MAG: formylglycine-generating enzyme family protein [Gammaproteobacteria bacterium]
MAWLRYLLLMYLFYFATYYAFAGPKFEKITKIEAGSFNMGCSIDDNECDPDEGNKGGTAVFVDSFYIQQHEVSVAEYRACVKTTKCIIPYTYQRNKYCNYNAPDRDAHPVNCISWPLAQNYCSVLGGRLPLEAEWEKAARAGTNTRYYWGHKIASCKHAVMDDQKTVGSVTNEFDGCGEDRTWPRGSKKPNQLGLYDMAGGTAEWVYNWFSETAITDLYANNKLYGPTTGSWKVIRGGAWDEQAWAQTNSNRWAKNPTTHSSIYGSNGFRCVFDSKNTPQPMIQKVTNKL